MEKNKFFKFKVDGKPYESETQVLTGKELKTIAGVLDFDLYLSNAKPGKDVLIEDCDLVDLSKPGLEHFFTKEHPNHYTIYVNGKEKLFSGKHISYDEVVCLAYPNCNYESTAYTVMYSCGPKKNPNGSMTKGDKVWLTDKMNFNVTATNRS